MTDKEFKRLSRSQLIDIIYQFQIKVEELTKENQKLSEALEDKRFRIAQAGNIAEAALEVNKVMESAQSAARQYLDEIQAMYSEADEQCQNIREKANAEASALMDQAQTEADRILRQAQTEAASILRQAQTEAEIIADDMERIQQEDAGMDTALSDCAAPHEM